jgi:hypothetical protein
MCDHYGIHGVAESELLSAQAGILSPQRTRHRRADKELCAESNGPHPQQRCAESPVWLSAQKVF